MLGITEITREKAAEFKAAVRFNQNQLMITRRLMLDVLAAAYESEEYIHPMYYDRVNDILALANSRDERLYKAIMKKEGLL